MTEYNPDAAPHADKLAAAIRRSPKALRAEIHRFATKIAMKHPGHDQKSHGNWSRGAVKPAVANYKLHDKIRGKDREDIERGLARVQEKVGPEATEGLTIRVAPQGKPGAYAWAPESQFFKKVMISPWYIEGKGREEFDAAFPKLRENGHFVKVPDGVEPWEYVVVHEVGHQVMGDGGGITGAELSTAAHSLSKYATSNVDEFLAESFVDYVFNDEPNPTSKKMGDALKDAL